MANRYDHPAYRVEIGYTDGQTQTITVYAPSKAAAIQQAKMAHGCYTAKIAGSALAENARNTNSPFML